MNILIDVYIPCMGTNRKKSNFKCNAQSMFAQFSCKMDLYIYNNRPRVCIDKQSKMYRLYRSYITIIKDLSGNELSVASEPLNIFIIVIGEL